MDTNWMSRARSCMRTKGISQERMAMALECTRGAISHYLAGRRIPNLQQLEAIASCLEVQPWWLIYGVSDGEIHEHAETYKPEIPITGSTDSGPAISSSGHLRMPGYSPPCYALQVTGNAYAPRMYAGEAVLLDPGIEVQPGDDVVIKFKDGPGVVLYTFINTKGSRLIVNEIMKNTQRHVFEKDQLEFMHCIVAVVRTNSVELE